MIGIVGLALGANTPAGAKIWNPAKIKLMQGGKLFSMILLPFQGLGVNYAYHNDPRT